MRPLSLLPLLTLLIGLTGCLSNQPQTTSPSEDPSPTPQTVPTATDLPPSGPPSLPPTPALKPTRKARPSPTLSSTFAPPNCLIEGGRIVTDTLRAESSPWPWEFRVYLPPCYDEEVDRRYPTLVLIHGSTFNDDQWDRLGADEVADRLIAAGEIEPFIILMPRDRRWVEPADDPFGDALIEHLIPWLDANYRTIPDREYRAIGGLSRGAAWAMHLGLLHWEMFSSIGGHSLPVFRSDSPYIQDWLTEIPPESMPRIYLDIGERDYLIDAAIWFEGVLNDLDIPHEWYLYPGRHEEVYWESHMETYLLWYAQGWEQLKDGLNPK